MTDTPIIDAPDVCATIEMQTDGTGLRFAIEPAAKWIHIYATMDHTPALNHIEHMYCDAGAECNVYALNMFEADEVISKMRMIITCYEAIKSQNAREASNGH